MVAWTDGFEHQSVLTTHFSATDSASIWSVIQNVDGGMSFVTGRVAGLALRQDETLGTNAQSAASDFEDTAQTSVALSVWVRMPSGAPAANSTILSLFNPAGTLMGALRFATTGTIGARAGAGSFDVGPNIDDAAWHHVDYTVDVSTTTFSGSWSVDGVSQGTFTAAGTASTISRIGFGSATGADNAIVDFDDAVVSNGADYPIGECEVRWFVPTGDITGTSNYGTNGMEDDAGNDINGTSVPGFSLVDNWPASTANPYMRQNGVGATEHADVSFDNMSDAAGIVMVRAVMGGWASSNTANHGAATVRDAAGTDLVDIWDGDMSETAMRWNSAMVPEPGGGWGTDWNGIKVAIGFSTTQGAIPRWSAIGLLAAVQVVNAAATPSTIAAVAALPAAGIPVIVPATTIAVVTALTTPSALANANPIPDTITGVGDVPTPTALVTSATFATPSTILVRVFIGTPQITATQLGQQYAFGYGGGYPPPTEAPAPEPEPIVVPPLSLLVQIDFDSDPGTLNDPRWVDVSDRTRGVEGFSLRRGRQRALDRIEAGTVTVAFNDADRFLDPTNSTSPQYPFVLPMRRIRLSAVFPMEPFVDAFTTGQTATGDPDYAIGGGQLTDEVVLFDGLIDSIQHSYPGLGKHAVATVTATDWLGPLARETFSLDLTQVFGSGSPLVYAVYAGERIHVILDQKPWAWRRGFDRDQPETAGFPRSSFMQMLLYQSAGMLESINGAVLVDGGVFYATRDGSYVYRWPDEQFQAPNPRLTMAADANRFSDIEFAYDETIIYNDVTVTSDATGVTHAEDSSSIARYFRRPLELSGPFYPTVGIIDLNGNQQARTDEIIARYAHPKRIIRRLTMHNVFTAHHDILGADIWDKLQVRAVMTDDQEVEQLSLIEGIEITSPNAKDWLVTWWLSDTPFPNLFDDENSDFEIAGVSPVVGSVGDWTAAYNATTPVSSFVRIEGGGWTPAWSPTGAGPSASTVAKGYFSLTFTCIADGDAAVQSGQVDVEPNRPYEASVLARWGFASQQANTPDQLVHLEVDWIDANDVVLSTMIGETVTFDIFPLNPTFKRIAVSGFSPPGAAQGRVRVVGEQWDASPVPATPSVVIVGYVDVAVFHRTA